ncbi:MAG: hypothetical protein ACLUI3_14815 [Christensenellales bacterium]
MDEKIEKFSVMRSLLAVERADACVIMIDANEGVNGTPRWPESTTGKAHHRGKQVGSVERTAPL